MAAMTAPAAKRNAPVARWDMHPLCISELEQLILQWLRTQKPVCNLRAMMFWIVLDAISFTASAYRIQHDARVLGDVVVRPYCPVRLLSAPDFSVVQA